jgi:hypothetical protein
MTAFWDAIGAIAPAVGGVIGSLISSDAAGDAADAQVAAANQSAAVQKQMYDQSRTDMAPYRDVGQNALYQMASLYGTEYENAPGTMQERMETAMGRFTTSPGYQFRMNEGVKALDRSAAARGRLQSGAQLKGVQDYAQGLASQEYGNYTNRLAASAGIGQTATQNTAQLGANAATNMGNTIMAGGTARASGYAGQANAVTDTTNSLLRYYGNTYGGR